MSITHYSVALFAPIEANLNNINSNNLGYQRLYEEEAIKCFSCWRQNGGLLAKIPIYAICPSRNVIGDATKEKLRELNVIYIEVFHEETLSYECGFWNIPLVGKWAEDNLHYDFLIKIDLDLYLINELPIHLLDKINEVDDLVGVHDSFAHEYLSSLGHDRYKPFYNTGLTVTKRSRRFFSDHYKYLFKMINEFNDNANKFNEKYDLIVHKALGPCAGKRYFEFNLLEELCVSIMAVETKRDFIQLKNYCLETMENELDGEITFNKDEVYFIHEHIDGANGLAKQLNRVRYAKFFGAEHGYRYFYEYR